MSCAFARTLMPPSAVPLRVSVVMPTKNRPQFLVDAVRTLLDQTAPPDELVIVDQSDDDEGVRRVAALVAGVRAPRRPQLVHVLDRAINGAAAARNAGFDRATGDIVVCCDDDVLAEPTVIERLLAHYRLAPEYAALAPVITNYPPPSVVRRIYRAMFCLGPFRDERQPVYWFWRRYPTPARVPVRMFTGAMMSFRRAALDGLRFDARYRAASVGEDIDLCWSLGARGARLAIATDTHIVHNKAPRPAVRPEAAQITSWAFLYDKHVHKTASARLAFAWYVTGITLAAVGLAVRERTWAPVGSALTGILDVFTDYARTTFLTPRRDKKARRVPLTASTRR